MNPTLAQVIMFAGTFNPAGWLFCQGQLLAISQNTALFALLGTTYGGNGQTNFAVPDLRGRIPVGTGQGPGLSNITLGEMSGSSGITLLGSQMPAHSHTVTGGGLKASNASATLNTPVGNVYGTASGNFFAPASTAGTEVLGGVTGTSTVTGSSQPFDNRMPFMAIHYVIAVQGIFPSRN